MPETRTLYDPELMWELLGLMMWSPGVIADVRRQVDPEDFGDGDERKVFTTIVNLHLRGAEVDPFLVREDLEDEKLMLRVLDASRDSVAVPGNATSFARKIHALGMLRRVRSIGADLTDVDPSMDPNEAIVRATDVLRAAGEHVASRSSTWEEIIPRIEDEIDGSHADLIVKTGIPQLDFLLDGGLHPKRLYILGARPGVGKSALAANIVRLALDAGQRTLFLSLEMSEREVITRMVAEKHDLNHSDVGGLVEAWNSETYRLNFMEKGNAADLEAEAYDLRRRDLRLIVVDYIQILDSGDKFDRRDLEIGYLTRMLKRLAMDLEVPVLGVSQVNRGADDRMPGLANLRESGNLEADANVCLLLHRRMDEHQHRQRASLVVAKNRHGQEGTISLHYRPDRTHFRQVDVA